MPFLNIFLILGVFSLIISFFTQGRSAIWGGATGGLIIGIIYALFMRDFSNLLRFVLIGADVGLFAEILALIGNKIVKRNI